jgi:hypothetical protein
MNRSVQRIRDMKNLGIKTEEMLARVGITTPHQLQKADPFEVYASLKRSAPGTSLVVELTRFDGQFWLRQRSLRIIGFSELMVVD